MASDHHGAAGIAESAAFCECLTAQPAAQKAAHERIARAEDIQDLDLKSSDHQALIDRVGDLAREGHAALAPTLAYQDCRGSRSHVADCSHGVHGTAEYAKLFFGADHQIAQRQHALQAFGHRRVGYEAVSAEILGSQPPHPGTIAHVDPPAPAMGLYLPRCRDTGGEYAGGG